jgi:hypothetical protein
MELHELPDLGRLESAGEVRRLHRGARTLEEILRSAAEAMDAEDRAEELARDPVLWARAHRPRTLWNRLLGRC